jgi:hypothetical protein
MQGYDRSNIALKPTYGSIQNNELHQAMQTGTVPSKLTGRVKKLKQFIKSMYFIIMCTCLIRNFELCDVKLGTINFTNKSHGI